METCKEKGYSCMYKKAVSKGTLTVKGRRIERILWAPIFEIYYNRRRLNVEMLNQRRFFVASTPLANRQTDIYTIYTLSNISLIFVSLV